MSLMSGEHLLIEIVAHLLPSMKQYTKATFILVKFQLAQQ